MGEDEPWDYFQSHYTGWSVAYRLYVIKQYLIARREDISQIIAAVCQK
jgi:hypothetical protein